MILGNSAVVSNTNAAHDVFRNENYFVSFAYQKAMTATGPFAALYDEGSTSGPIRFSDKVEATLADVFPNYPKDPIDQPTFDPVEYVNRRFPDEHSLHALPSFIADLQAKLNDTDACLMDAVRGSVGRIQPAVGAQPARSVDGKGEKQRDVTAVAAASASTTPAQQSIANAKVAVADLHAKVIAIRTRADQTNHFVHEVSDRVKHLNTARTQLKQSAAAIKQLAMLVLSLRELDALLAAGAAPPPPPGGSGGSDALSGGGSTADGPAAAGGSRLDYHNMNRLLRQAQRFYGRLGALYNDVPKVKQLRDRLQDVSARIELLVKTKVVEAIRRGISSDMPKSKRDELLAACSVVDAVGPAAVAKVRTEIVTAKLAPIDSIFVKGSEDIKVERVEKRFKTLRTILEQDDVLFRECFPPRWRVAHELCVDFCNRTLRDLNVQLGEEIGSLDTNVLSVTIPKVIDFERYLTSRLRILDEETGRCRPSSAAAAFDGGAARGAPRNGGAIGEDEDDAPHAGGGPAVTHMAPASQVAWVSSWQHVPVAELPADPTDRAQSPAPTRTADKPDLAVAAGGVRPPPAIAPSAASASPKDCCFFNFSGHLVQVFLPHMDKYVEFEDSSMAKALDEVLKNDDVVEELFILQSAQYLFSHIDGSLSRVLSIEHPATFVRMCSVWIRHLTVYAQGLLHSVRQPPASEEDDMKYCVVLNTADFCSKRTAELDDILEDVMKAGPPSTPGGLASIAPAASAASSATVITTDDIMAEFATLFSASAAQLAEGIALEAAALMHAVLCNAAGLPIPALDQEAVRRRAVAADGAPTSPTLSLSGAAVAGTPTAVALVDIPPLHRLVRHMLHDRVLTDIRCLTAENSAYFLRQMVRVLVGKLTDQLLLREFRGLIKETAVGALRVESRELEATLQGLAAHIPIPAVDDDGSGQPPLPPPASSVGRAAYAKVAVREMARLSAVLKVLQCPVGTIFIDAYYNTIPSDDCSVSHCAKLLEAKGCRPEQLQPLLNRLREHKVPHVSGNAAVGGGPSVVPGVDGVTDVARAPSPVRRTGMRGKLAVVAALWK